MTSSFLAFTAIVLVSACNISMSLIFGAVATQTFRSVSAMLLFAVIPIVRVWKNEDHTWALMLVKKPLKVKNDFCSAGTWVSIYQNKD